MDYSPLDQKYELKSSVDRCIYIYRGTNGPESNRANLQEEMKQNHPCANTSPPSPPPGTQIVPPGTFLPAKLNFWHWRQVAREITLRSRLQGNQPLARGTLTQAIPGDFCFLSTG